MARELRHFIVPVPAGTTQAAPLVTDISFPVREVTEIHWRLPPGCSGLVGFYVSMGKVQVQPLPQGTWVIGDGEAGSWPMDDQPNSGAWQITAYNTGNNPHSIHFDFHCDIIEPHREPLMLIDPVALSHYTSQPG